MAIATFELKNINDAVSVATTLRRSWFRGHETVVGELTPRLFRPPFDHYLITATMPRMELGLIESFKRDAPTLTPSAIPAREDHLGWLYLMQHFSAPTRLLDWTQNLLVAVWFAVRKLDCDGEVWALFPQALNEVGDVGPGLPIIERNPVLRFLVEEPYFASPAAGAKELGLASVPRTPAAFIPRREFPRMMAQGSVFTIHPKPEPGFTICDLLTDKKHLVRYIIPRDSKAFLLADLISLGVNERSVFPDFEGLSRYVRYDSWSLPQAPLTPPSCSGKWSPDPTAPGVS